MVVKQQKYLWFQPGLSLKTFSCTKLFLEKRKPANLRSELFAPIRKDRIPNQLLFHLPQKMSQLDNHIKNKCKREREREREHECRPS